MQASLFLVGGPGVALAVQSVLGALDCLVVPRPFCIDGWDGIEFQAIEFLHQASFAMGSLMSA